MSKNGLVKIKKHVLDGEYGDIEELGIYFDSVSGQYKHKFKCRCGKDFGCYCYHDIDDAIQDIENGMACRSCWIKDQLSILVFEDIDYAIEVDKIAGTKIADQIRILEMIQNGELYSSDDEYASTRESEIIKEVEQTIESLSEEISLAIDRKLYIDRDCEFYGMECEV
ncbi:MAG TPA: hypothetical protein PLV00_07095 [Caldisericia bacterium]|nr:hypothetical protein [Caldisericia bacterium]